MADLLVAGVDVSTQSCTVEIRRSDDLEVIGRARTPLPPTSPPVSEQNALDWWAALVDCFHQLSSRADLSLVGAISVSGQCHGLVALDAAGRPVRRVKLWNDTSTAPYLDELFTRIDRKEWVHRTGSIPTAAFTISKLAWYLAVEPQNAAITRKIVLPHDYVNYRLTGVFATDRSEASGTGYFDSVKNDYDYELLRHCFGDSMEWESLFPEVLSPSDCLGFVQGAASRELGVPEGIPVAVGGGDQHVAALGLGLGSGDVVFSLGTSGVVIASSSTPVRDPTGRVNGVANAVGGWLPLVCTLNSTKVTDWLAEILEISVQQLDALALEAGAEEATPAFATYLDGERSPSFPMSAGVIAGITGSTSRAAFAKATFEGVLGGLIRGMEDIRACGVPLEGRVIAIGGGARSSAYTTFLADMLGRPVEVIREPEATARGACVQAKALLDGSPVEEAAQSFKPPAERIVEPRSAGRSWMRIRGEYLRTCDFAGSLDRTAF